MATIDLEDRVELTKQLAEGYNPQSFFRAMCGTELHKTSTLVLHQDKKTRQIAPYVADNINDGKVMARDGFERIMLEVPTVNPTRCITGRDVEFTRNASTIVEISDSGATPETMMQDLVTSDMGDLQDGITRREEQQIIEGLTTGAVHVVGEGVDRTITLPVKSGHIFNVASADKFDAAGANPIAWLRKTRSGVLVKDGGGAGKVAVFGGQAFDAFCANGFVKDFLDNKRYEFGSIAPREDQMFDGVTYQGTILGMDIYTYDEWYYNETTKKDVAMMPEKQVIILGSKAGLTMHYGAIADGAQGTINVCKSYAYTWLEGGKTKWLGLESKPLFVPKNAGGFVTATVL